jgi:hypothetical protein
VLLVSDIDNTLYAPNEAACAALERFAMYWVQTHLFNGSVYMLNTCRSIDQVEVIWAEEIGWALLKPVIIATCNAGEMWIRN